MHINPELKYHALVRTLHWVMMLAFAVIFVLGVVMVAFKDAEPWTLYEIHKSTGVLVFLLVWLRLATRAATRKPAYPDYIPTEIQRLAKSTVVLLYVGMIVVPITGYATSNVNGFGVKFYGYPLPQLFPELPAWGDFVSTLHSVVAYGFLAIIVLHILGVIYHHVRGEDILHRVT